MKSYRLYAYLATGILLLFVMTTASHAQDKEVRASLGATVTQVLGADTRITITYSRPGVKDRQIWGELVPYGLAPGNKYSKEKPYPWRAGANENTTIEVSGDVLIGGKPLPAGKYGIHMIPSEKEWIIIFSKTSDSWGSYSYDEADDALRITVTPATAAHQEWLAYGFDNLAAISATAFLHWEKLKVPFSISLPQM